MADLQAIKENISIIDLAVQLGFTPYRIGNFYSIKEMDSIRISPQKNLFIRNSTGEAGTNIDFLCMISGISKAEAINFLADELQKLGYNVKNINFSKAPKKELEKKSFILPAKDNNIKNIYSYLLNTRKIDKSVITLFLSKKLLYQDKHKNCVFVSYNDTGKAVFANLRGTNTKKKFIGDISGSDYNHCFFIDNNSKKLIITESVIDAMSVMSMKLIAEKAICENFLALSGTTKMEQSLKYHLQKNKYEEVICFLDSDNAADLAFDKAKEVVKSIDSSIRIDRKLPGASCKDFNDYLKLIADKNNIEYVKFMYQEAFLNATQKDILDNSKEIINSFNLNKEIADDKFSLEEYTKEYINCDKLFFEELREYDKNLDSDYKVIKELEKELEEELVKDEKQKIVKTETDFEL